MIAIVIGMFGLNPMELLILGGICFLALPAVIAVVVVSLLSRQKNAAPMATCSHCGQFVAAGDRFCRQCGKPVG